MLLSRLSCLHSLSLKPCTHKTKIMNGKLGSIHLLLSPEGEFYLTASSVIHQLKLKHSRMRANTKRTAIRQCESINALNGEKETQYICSYTGKSEDGHRVEAGKKAL